MSNSIKVFIDKNFHYYLLWEVMPTSQVEFRWKVNQNLLEGGGWLVIYLGRILGKEIPPPRLVEVFLLPFGGIGHQGSSHPCGGVNKVDSKVGDFSLVFIQKLIKIYVFGHFFNLVCPSSLPSIFLLLILCSLLWLETFQVAHYVFYFFFFHSQSTQFCYFLIILFSVLMENEGNTRRHEFFHCGNKEVFIFLGNPLFNLLVCFHL